MLNLNHEKRKRNFRIWPLLGILVLSELFLLLFIGRPPRQVSAIQGHESKTAYRYVAKKSHTAQNTDHHKNCPRHDLLNVKCASHNTSHTHGGCYHCQLPLYVSFKAPDPLLGPHFLRRGRGFPRDLLRLPFLHKDVPTPPPNLMTT